MKNTISYKKYFDLNKLVSEIRQYLPNLNEKRFVSVFEFAEQAHRGQMRKDNITPYIVHPVEVMKILVKLHADEEVLLSTLLHDVPEDTEHTISEVEKLFGRKVAFLVNGITKLSKVQYRHNMPARQIESLKKLFLHSAKDPRVILIKLADRLHNMRTLENIDKPEKRLRIAKETLEIYVPIANVLGIHEMKSKLEELCFKNIFPTEYEKILGKFEENYYQHKPIAKKFIRAVSDDLRKAGIKARVKKRKKNLYSVYKKICAQGKAIDNIDGRIAIRITVNTIQECYQTLGIIHGRFVPKSARFKDYIANPKPNGYQSLHTTVFGIDGLLTEIQIKTEKMHREAEYGIAAHFFVGTKKERHEDLVKTSNWANQVLDMAKAEQNADKFMENLKLDLLQDRILVFSPRGQTIDLPSGATAIDFAYAIHSDVGEHAMKAVVNGQRRPMTSILKTGDTIKIQTDAKSHPQLFWLSFAKTNLAKNKIKNHLKKSSRQQKIKEGCKILQKTLDIGSLGFLCKDIKLKKIRPEIEKKYGKKFQTKDDLYAAIGDGTVKPTDVVKAFQSVKSHRKEETGSSLKVVIKIRARNRFGLLKEIADVLYKNVIDMRYLKGWSAHSDKDGLFKAHIVIDDLESLSKIFDELLAIDDVISVYRPSYVGKFLLYFTALVSITGWVMHPLVLKAVVDLDLTSRYGRITDVLLYMGFFSLIFMVMYMTRLVKRYFPIIRQRDMMWRVTFATVTLSGLILISELIYFHVKFSWIVILTGIITIYIYLAFAYSNFKKMQN